MHVLHFLAQEGRRENVARVVAILPDFVPLALDILCHPLKELEHGVVVFGLILSDDLFRCVLLELPHNV